VISRTDLQKMAQAKLEDAEALLQAKRYDSAVYICGYAIELALKARICTSFQTASSMIENTKSLLREL